MKIVKKTEGAIELIKGLSECKKFSDYIQIMHRISQNFLEDFKVELGNRKCNFWLISESVSEFVKNSRQILEWLSKADKFLAIDLNEPHMKTYQ